MKMLGHHDKQLTPSESWYRDGFFKTEFGVLTQSNHWARICTTLGPTNQVEHLVRVINL